MSKFIQPNNYKPVLSIYETQTAIGFLKHTFERELSSALNLKRVSAPLFVEPKTGLNDNLNGVERPVSFDIAENGATAEVVHSLAKWKRMALYKYNFSVGEGIYTDMNALRPDETIDNIHSVYVDQWDWEKVITPEERTPERLQLCVERIYAALKRTEFLLSEQFPVLQPFLPDRIHFIHAEELRKQYPGLSPKEREERIACQFGAVFIRGIGGALGDGTIHDDRSPDYDDWSTEAEDGSVGLNGDIIVWNPVLQSAFEISSMGIRVDRAALEKQLWLKNAGDRKKLYFHSLLLEGKLPQTMGGGIGQSRLCMLLLQKCHIGEVQAGLWPDEVLTECEKAGVFLF